MPDWTYRALIAGLWLAWLAYWVVAARNGKAVQRRESSLSRASYLVPLLVGAVLLAAQHVPLGWLSERFLPQGPAAYWTGATLLAAGLAFSAWARHHLGHNWSGTVTLMQGHELIRTGPYRIVRHPIYTGLLTAILGTAVTLGQWRGLVALVLFTGGILRKISIEERLMCEIFPDQYARYSAEVPALVPLIY